MTVAKAKGSVTRESTKVLDNLHIAMPGHVLFGQPDMENATQLVLNKGDWESMGEPDVLTVTLQAGDRLNV